MGAFTLWHEPLNLGDRDGASQGYQLEQPTATLGSWPMPPSCFNSTSSPGRLVPPQALSCSYSLVSKGRVCSPRLGVSWCTATHSWARGLLPAAGDGQSCEQAYRAAVPPKLAGASSPHLRVPHQNSCYGKFVDFFLFLFFFFFSSCAQTSPDLLRRLWHIILQMWHRSPGCKIYPARQLVVLCNLHQLTETTVRYY